MKWYGPKINFIFSNQTIFTYKVYSGLLREINKFFIASRVQVHLANKYRKIHGKKKLSQ